MNKRLCDGSPDQGGQSYRYSSLGFSNKLIIIAGLITFVVIIGL
jgi:hypothetical protein